MAHARLTLVTDPDDPDRFDITCLGEGRPQPFKLNGTDALLFVHQAIRVVGNHCQTLSYSYRLNHSPSRRDWIVRWEYLRQPPASSYDYPLAHLHLKADLADDVAALMTTKPATKLHLATGRVAFELVLWHLISDWSVAAIKTDWKAILNDSIRGFEDRRTVP